MAIFKSRLTAVFPSRREIFPVFSMVVFVVFTWSIYRMTWQLQSWLFIVNLKQVFILAAYVLAFGLLESLVMLGFVLFLALVVPARFFKDKFIAQGTALVGILTLGAIIIQNYPNLFDGMSLAQLALVPVLILAGITIFLLLFSTIFDHYKGVTQRIVAFADRLTVFSYIYIPLSLIGLIVVIVRNMI